MNETIKMVFGIVVPAEANTDEFKKALHLCGIDDVEVFYNTIEETETGKFVCAVKIVKCTSDLKSWATAKFALNLELVGGQYRDELLYWVA